MLDVPVLIQDIGEWPTAKPRERAQPTKHEWWLDQLLGHPSRPYSGRTVAIGPDDFARGLSSRRIGMLRDQHWIRRGRRA